MKRNMALTVGMVLLIAGAMVLSAFGASVSSLAPESNSIEQQVRGNSTLYLNGFVFDCLADEPVLPPTLTAQPKPGTVDSYIVHMTGPIVQRWVDSIHGLGIDIVTYVPNYAYQVRMTPEQAQLAANLPFVDWVGSYHPGYKLSADVATGTKITVSLEGSDIPKETLESVRSALKVFGESDTGTGYIFHGFAGSTSGLYSIAALPHVQFITPYQEPELMDEAGSQIIGGYMWYQDPDNNVATPYRTLGSHGAYANQLGYDGAGITLGIADTGLGNGAIGNAGHNDFTGRVIGGHSFGGGAWSDGHGHGTHCAGLAIADSFEGNGVTYSGFGPYYATLGLGHEANIYAEKIFTDAGGWIGPADYGEILTVGYAGGARIHTNSWGSNSGGAYGAADQAYDTRTRDSDTGAAGNQQMVIFVAAGNAYNLNTVGSPGNGKNVISIAATENYMPDSMARGNTDENGDNPDGITDFSSKGWTDDGRVKPDISAPGRATLSTRSPNVASSNLYGFYTPDTRYEWCSGTSQACPTAAGAGIAVMDWYNTVYGSMPTPAMVKALMINSAIDIPDEDNDGNPNNAYPIPNQYEGWGRIYIPTIVDPVESWLVYDAPTELTTGTYNEYTFTYVNTGVPVKITLAYTDVYALSGASVTLINDLNLQVTSPTGAVYHGNAFSGGLTPADTNPSATFDTNSDGWDDRNTVECVYIAPGDLESGLYTVRITGFNVPGDCDNDGSNDQDYSLVIHNAQDVTSYGLVNIQNPKYPREASVQVAVMDMDLNTNGNVQTTSITVTSVAEPAGESVLLTETGGDTGVFQGSLTISGTNAAGVLWVNPADLITATYNDADYGGTGPMTLTDNAIIDGTPPGSPSGLTVEWYGLVQQEFFIEDFEGDGTPTFGELGWTLGGASNDWQIGTPAGLGGDPTGAYSGAFSIGNDLTGIGTNLGQYENGLALDSNIIYSAPIDCTGYTSVSLQFQRWFGAESATFDHAYVEVSTSPSGPWTEIWSHTGATVAATAWSQVSYNIGAVADNQPAVYVRFEMGNTDGSVAGCGWNIDNMALLGLTSGTMHNTVNWTLSSDDGAGANDVDHYNIYRSTAEAGPWDVSTLIDTVPAGTGTYVDPDRGEYDGINWWYLIRAIDDIGNEDMNTNAVPEIPLVNVPPSAPNTPTPANGAIAVSVDPVLSVRAADPNGDQLTVRFYDASGPTLIGTNFNVPSGTFTTMPWSGRLPTTVYSWYATADDGEYLTNSATWSFTTIDTTPPGPPSGLTVEWTGTSSATLIDQDFSDTTFPPAGWTQSGPTNQWTRQTTANAGGTSPEARFGWVSNTNIWRLYAGPMDTSGMSSIDLEFRQFFDDYGAGLTVKLQTSSNGATWTDEGWSIVSGGGDVGPNIVTRSIANSDVGSSTFYISWTVDGNAYQLDYWYVDDVLLTYTGGATTDDNLLTWTLSTDDGAGANDVSHYNIYRSDNAAGPWDLAHIINTVTAGTSSYQDIGRGEVDGINWWYVVRAEDIWGNEDSNTIAVPELAVGTPYSINLVGRTAGQWVFVSFPIDVSGNIASILNDAQTTWDVAKWYDGQTKSWKSYRAGGTQSFTTINNQMGVWLHLSANGGDQLLTTTLSGAYPAGPVAINLYAGWNMVGYPSATNRLASATLPPQADMVAVWQAATPYITDLAPGSVTMSHGNAYWVRVTADCTWTVQP